MLPGSATEATDSPWSETETTQGEAAGKDNSRAWARHVQCGEEAQDVAGVSEQEADKLVKVDTLSVITTLLKHSYDN